MTVANPLTAVNRLTAMVLNFWIVSVLGSTKSIAVVEEFS